MFTDTHSHIHFARDFPDIDAIIERADQAKVSRQIIVGCTPEDSYQAIDFVKKYSNHMFWSTLGVHPHYANQWNKATELKFEELAGKEKKIVALGEIGLDYFRNLQPKDVQEAAFRGQLRLAKKLDLPAVVHVRDAWDDALKILEEEGNKGVILHCFTGNMEKARTCFERGYFISFSGVVTYPKNAYLREIAAAAPSNKLLIETDCPYLTPQTYRGKRNEPAYLVETAKVLADVRSVTISEFGRQSTENAKTIFGVE